MAQAKRNDSPLPSWEQADRQRPVDSPIALLQADLARRLNQEAVQDPRPDALSPAERLVQSVSAAGGYIGLGLGYAMAGLAISWWLLA